MTGADGQSPSRVVAGRYQLEQVLGRGGMGVVWRAVDTLIERTVAIKELRAPTGASEEERASFVERALREARNAGRLNHPGVVAVHDVISQPGEYDVVYIVMEYVPAPSLAEILDRDGPLPGPRVAKLGLGILDALDAAHAMGIVHRDIKPGNVLVAAGDRVKLTDFGIALAAEDARLTKSGVIGTQAYLAPECFDTGHAGPAADLWALGATLYHAVTGRAPFDRDTTTATLRAILFEDPPPPPGNPRLAEAISGLLTRPVEQRLSSDAARQLLEPVASQPITAPGTDAGAPWEANATGLYRPPLTGQPTPPPTGPGAFSGNTGQTGPTTPGSGFGPPTIVPTGQGQPPMSPAAQGTPTQGTGPFPPSPAEPFPPQGPAGTFPPGPAAPFPPQGPAEPFSVAQGMTEPFPPVQGPPPQGPPGQGPPPQHPPYGGSWGGPPPGGRSKTPLILGIVGVVVVIGGVLAAVLLMGGSKSSNGPKDAVDKLFKADVAKSLDGMKAIACGKLLDDLNHWTSDSQFDKSYKIGKVSQQGDSAEVAVHLTGPTGKEGDLTASTQKSDGKWKVCDVEAGAPSDGGGDSAAVKNVVRRLLEAAKTRDLSTAQSLSCDPLRGKLEDFPTISSYEVGSATVSGNSAEVQVTATSQGESDDGVAELQKQSGSWKVCDVRDASSSSSGSSGGPGLPSEPDFPTDTRSTDFGSSDSDEPSPSGSTCITLSNSTPICIPD